MVGYGKYVYRHVPGWGNLPDGWDWNHAVGVGIDAQDRVFVYNRSDHPMIVLDTDGNVLDSWGEGMFGSAHHLEVGPDGSLYTTDIGNHTVRKWTPDGQLLMTLGDPGNPPERMSGDPFNAPTDVAIAADGTIYVSDGYGNARIHHFHRDRRAYPIVGRARRRAGAIPHPAQRLLGQHRQRVRGRPRKQPHQIFTPDGQYVSEWGGVHRPDHIWQGPDGNMYVTDLGFRQGLGPDKPDPHEVSHPAGVKIMTPTGQWLGGWGMSTDTPGDIIAGHAIAMDSKGNLYVGETLDGARVQKFELTYQ